MSDASLDELRRRAFAREREREQFTPILSLALAGAVGELLEVFQWLTPKQATEVMDAGRADDARDELANVPIYRGQQSPRRARASTIRFVACVLALALGRCTI